MPRVRMKAEGINIALPGYSVDDGEEFLSFSAKAIALPIYLRGTVGLSGSGVDTGAPQPFNHAYWRMTVPLGRTFSAPPIVIFVAKYVGASMAFLPTLADVRSAIISGTQRHAFSPIFVEVELDRIHLWNIFTEVESMSYLVLENTLS